MSYVDIAAKGGTAISSAYADGFEDFSDDVFEAGSLIKSGGLIEIAFLSVAGLIGLFIFKKMRGK